MVELKRVQAGEDFTCPYCGTGHKFAWDKYGQETGTLFLDCVCCTEPLVVKIDTVEGITKFQVSI